MHWPRNMSIRRELMPSGSSVSTTRSQTSEQTHNTRKFKVVSDRSLDPTTGLLKIRLTEGIHFPSPSDKKDPVFQLHSWACIGKKYRKGYMLCTKCQVTLCLKCFVRFHAIKNPYYMKYILCE